MRKSMSYHLVKWAAALFGGFFFSILGVAAGTAPVPGYAIGHLRNVSMGPAIVEYLQRIDSTLKPFRGQFIVHGGKLQRLEATGPATSSL